MRLQKRKGVVNQLSSPAETTPVVDTVRDQVLADVQATLGPGYTGGETRMQLLVRLVNSRSYVGINVKTDVPNEVYTVDSIANVFAGANWHEREAHEMFGIGFIGHPDLRNMYLPSDFEGFPMRKDFPLLARMVKPWPGIVDVEPLPGGDADQEEAS